MGLATLPDLSPPAKVTPLRLQVPLPQPARDRRHRVGRNEQPDILQEEQGPLGCEPRCAYLGYTPFGHIVQCSNAPQLPFTHDGIKCYWPCEFQAAAPSINHVPRRGAVVKGGGSCASALYLGSCVSFVSLMPMLSSFRLSSVIPPALGGGG